LAAGHPPTWWALPARWERVVYTSPSFERVWACGLKDLYQNPRLWTEAIHPEDRARVADIFSQWIAGADVSCSASSDQMAVSGGFTNGGCSLSMRKGVDDLARVPLSSLPTPAFWSTWLRTRRGSSIST
jgi:hypothetical protein